MLVFLPEANIFGHSIVPPLYHFSDRSMYPGEMRNAKHFDEPESNRILHYYIILYS